MTLSHAHTHTHTHTHTYAHTHIHTHSHMQAHTFYLLNIISTSFHMKCRHRIAERCRSLLIKQRAHFVNEREETVQLVIRECTDIIQVWSRKKYWVVFVLRIWNTLYSFLSLSISIFLFRSLSISISLSLIFSLFPPLSHTHCLSLVLTHYLSLSLPYPHPNPLYPSHAFSLFHTHTCAHIHCPSLALTHCLSLSLPHSHSHPYLLEPSYAFPLVYQDAQTMLKRNREQRLQDGEVYFFDSPDGAVVNTRTHSGKVAEGEKSSSAVHTSGGSGGTGFIYRAVVDSSWYACRGNYFLFNLEE